MLSFSELSWGGLLPLKGKDLLSGKDLEIRLEAVPRASVLLFLSAKCPCSASHEGVLRELVQDFSALGFQFIGIHSNGDEPLDWTRAHFERSQLPFPLLRDEGALLANRFGAFKTPHVFVVNAQGETLYQGGVDDSHQASRAKKPYLRKALAAIVGGEKPDPAQTRTLGCVIQR